MNIHRLIIGIFFYAYMHASQPPLVTPKMTTTQIHKELTNLEKQKKILIEDFEQTHKNCLAAGLIGCELCPTCVGYGIDTCLNTTSAHNYAFTQTGMLCGIAGMLAFNHWFRANTSEIDSKIYLHEQRIRLATKKDL